LQAEEFSYTDPIDGSVSSQQGICITFEDGSRIIFRLSGTGSSGATIRMYVDKYQAFAALADIAAAGSAAEALKPLIEVAIKVSNLEALTGREEPTVIT